MSTSTAISSDALVYVEPIDELILKLISGNDADPYLCHQEPRDTTSHR